MLGYRRAWGDTRWSTDGDREPWTWHVAVSEHVRVLGTMPAWGEHTPRCTQDVHSTALHGTRAAPNFLAVT